LLVFKTSAFNRSATLPLLGFTIFGTAGSNRAGSFKGAHFGP
jgi:hypothetical protein